MSGARAYYLVRAKDGKDVRDASPMTFGGALKRLHAEKDVVAVECYRGGEYIRVFTKGEKS